MDKNLLIYGDNLDVMQQLPDGVADLVYLDPPFNSAAEYNILFGGAEGGRSQAQIRAFDDTWHWTPETEAIYRDLVGGRLPLRVAETLESMRHMLGDREGDLLAYLVMMTPRLTELRRLLADGGSLYLHCDPTASHYLKLILDSVFGPEHFVNEVIWKRTSAHNRTVRYGPVHDVLLFYAKSDDWTWNPVYTPYDQSYIDRHYRHTDDDGRRYRLDNLTSNKPGNRELFQGNPPPGDRYWGYAIETLERFAEEGRIIYTKNGYPQYKRYLDEMPGRLAQDVWTDINPVSPNAKERLDYPTQKPEALLERIIKASSNQGDVVLDPFCGCGTTVAIAQELDREWIGIDITTVAVDLMDRRLRDKFGDSVAETYEIRGIPEDVVGAKKLHESDEFEFERWAVLRVHGQPNEQQRGDRGKDGIMRVQLGPDEIGRVIISVKGGEHLTRSMVQELAGAVEEHNAIMGLLITIHDPTRGMNEAADRGGVFTWDMNGRNFPKLQIMTIKEILDGKRPDTPPVLDPHKRAQRIVDATSEQLDLLAG